MVTKTGTKLRMVHEDGFLQQVRAEKGDRKFSLHGV